MYPRLLELGPDHRVYTYGVLLAAAYLLGLKLAMVRAKARGLDQARVLDLGIYIIISALIGAKLLLLVTDFRHVSRAIRASCSTLARSGGVFYGGLILAVAVALWYIRRVGPAALDDLDVFAPGIALGHVVGRFGCFFAGCCYGQADDGAVGDHVYRSVRRGERRDAAERAAPPDAALRSRAPRRSILWCSCCDRAQGAAVSRDGRSGCTCCSTRSPASSSSSTGATSAGTVGMFSTSQFISLILAPLAIVMLVYSVARRAGAGARPAAQEAA